jgi:hypothetical protein
MEEENKPKKRQSNLFSFYAKAPKVEETEQNQTSLAKEDHHENVIFENFSRSHASILVNIRLNLVKSGPK